MNSTYLRGFLLASPFVFTIISFFGNFSPISNVLVMAIWMITWWIFEVMPLGITALIPAIFLPLAGIISLKSTLGFYAHPIIYLFLGGFIIAQALERTKLSERFAILILKYLGKSAHGVLLGFIIATAFLSMWISNTATTVMMIPIADSILKFLELHTNNSKSEMRKLSICILLGIAHAANIGGTMTPIGTPPNVVLMGYLQELYSIEIDFARWMLIVAPASICLLACVYFLLSFFLYPFKIEIDKSFQIFLQNQLKMLGYLTFAQKMTLTIFISTCCLWIFKQPINGFLGQKILSDTLIALVGGVSLFFIPSNKKLEPVLSTQDINKLPWNIVLLFGGGMALANSLATVGLLEQVSQMFQADIGMELYWFVFLSSALVLFLTEVMSNVALCTVALPIFLTLAQTKGYHPLIIGIPITLCSSYAFSMPISTPPNAIVFSTGKLSIKHMLRAGVLTNILGILLTMTLGWAMINLFY